jgi:sensor histidine kinase YesM
MSSNIYIPKKTVLLISIILGFFLIYPNTAKLLQGSTFFRKEVGILEFSLFFLFRYLYFTFLCYFLLTKSIKLDLNKSLFRRATWSFCVAGAAFILYLFISFLSGRVLDWFSVILMFQFMSMWVICTLMAYAYTLYAQKLVKEDEIEQLKLDSLRSQYDALTNQVNPHFFFNSLNTLSALVRTGDSTRTLSYIQNLSSVFRYVLSSEGKGTVTLDAELAFLDAFSFLQRTKYGANISFLIDIPPEKQHLNIPVLSLLPILENIPKHNVIDSTMKMEVTISLNDEDELVVRHRKQPKLETTTTKGGLGLKNLKNRFRLLLNRDIIVQDDDGYFTVRLPLHENE